MTSSSLFFVPKYKQGKGKTYMYNENLAKNYMQLLKLASDPLEAIKTIPNAQNVMNMIQGKDPKAVFYSECDRLGIDPEQVIKLLK